MLRPKDIRENLDNFNAVTRDAVEHMLAIGGEDNVIPDLEGELAKYATEGKLVHGGGWGGGGVGGGVAKLIGVASKYQPTPLPW